MRWQRLADATRLVDFCTRPMTWLFLHCEGLQDILRQRGYVPLPPQHLRVALHDRTCPAEPVHVIHVVEGPAHFRLRDPATNELVDIIVVRNPRGYVPQP